MSNPQSITTWLLGQLEERVSEIEDLHNHYGTPREKYFTLNSADPVDALVLSYIKNERDPYENDFLITPELNDNPFMVRIDATDF